MGDQPIFNEDRSILVVYNGEIYNYQALKEELVRIGHIFTTHTDTEVIVHAYEQWRMACFDMFNGMFGMALYDRNTHQLILARDHFGIKPLYYAHLAGGQLLFASEIKPILHSHLVVKKPNERIIYRYLRYRVHDDQAETFFAGIYKLMPGELMIVTPQATKKAYFSRLKQELQDMAERPLQKEDIETFGVMLSEAIKIRLVSEVPVGTCLSGGLDSSTVVAAVSKLLEEHASEAEAVGEHQNSFSAVFPGSSNNEEQYIDELISRHDSIKSWKIYPKPDEFFEDLEDFVRTQEEPITSTGPYAQYKVMQEAAEHVTVLLDGQGADEMMAGYLPYYFVYLRQLLRQKRYIPLFFESLYARDVIVKYLWDKVSKVLRIRKELSIRPLLNPEFHQRYSSERFPVIQDDIKRRLIEDIFHNSLPCLLRYEDKNGMRFSLEGRVPFLDFNVLRYLFSLSDQAIIFKGWNDEKGVLHANPGKSVEIQLNSQTYARFPLKTDVFQKGDDLAQKIHRHILAFLEELPASHYDGRGADWYKDVPWFIVLSEKIVAISQGRSFFLCDIKPGFFAKLLSRYVRRTPAGIGLGSPWTMQLAINEVGLLRILLAATVAAVTKPLGAKGWFYRIAGWKASSIDGPTAYSLYPSNVSAKLGPKDPDKVVKHLHAYLHTALPQEYARCFQGAVIIDANDLGQQVLGNSTPLRAREIEGIFKDNPMGQEREQTPVTVVFPV